MPINTYIVKGFDVSLYCKITNERNEKGMMYTISFGGKNNFCFVSSINPKKPFEVYIVNIEYNEACLKDAKLEERGGIVKLVRIALWTIKNMFPEILRFTFTDSSHIDCIKGIKTHKLNLAYDYILKYNQTWYEKQFNAKLPGSITDDSCMLNSLMYIYKVSLLVLDEPVEPFSIIKDKINIAEKYKHEYETSKSPRDFINKLRDKYKSEYCVEVSNWLSRYMKALEIKIFQESWYIDTASVKEPPHYSKDITKNLIRGGFTRKNSIKNKFISFEGEESNIGYYNTYE